MFCSSSMLPPLCRVLLWPSSRWSLPWRVFFWLVSFVWSSQIRGLLPGVLGVDGDWSAVSGVCIRCSRMILSYWFEIVLIVNGGTETLSEVIERLFSFSGSLCRVYFPNCEDWLKTLILGSSSFLLSREFCLSKSSSVSVSWFYSCFGYATWVVCFLRLLDLKLGSSSKSRSVFMVSLKSL